MTSPRYASFSQEDDCSKQRASKACNRCRAKEARCSGGYSCSRCKSSDTMCIFGFAKKSKRKVFHEHYVRTLEMQQFKLAAGLQTMYFILLAAKAWPGTQLPEHKGNPLVHDVLDRLGLLEHKDDQDIDFGSAEHEIDTQHSSAEEVLPMEHPKHDHDAVQASPIPPAIHAEESQGSRLQLEQSMLSQFPENESNLDRAIGPCNPQPLQYKPSSGSLELRTAQSGFSSRPPPKMAVSLPSNPAPPRGVAATIWQDHYYSPSCWPRNQQYSQSTAYPDFKSRTAVPAIPLISNTSDPFGPAAYHHSSYLVDPGQYGCDFDVV